MKIQKLLKTSGLAALSASIALAALPAELSAQSNNGWNNRGERASAQRSGNRSDRANRIERRGNDRAQRIERRSERRAERVERQGDRRAAAVQRRTNDAPARVERQGDRRSAQIDRRSEQRANRIENRGDRVARNEQIRAGQRADNARDRDGNRDRDRDYNSRRGIYSNTAREHGYREPNATNNRGDRLRAEQRRNRTYADRDRNRTYRDRNYRDGYRDNDRDHRHWDRRWRDNNRYNWHDHRRAHRNIYRLGRYYSPYRSWSYRRLSIGFNLDTLFYSSRYWIDDPWQYRLPPAYGPYRWVRYYDDALLVDTYSGEVVDVIYDFFW